MATPDAPATSVASYAPSAPDRYAVVGHPIAHSRSPTIHARFAAATGQHIEYGRIDAAPGEFEHSVHAFFNDDRPEVYQEDHAALAWQRTLAFLRRCAD